MASQAYENKETLTNLLPIQGRALGPMLFEGSICPRKHLKQFSSRDASSGSEARAGAVTLAAGAITAIAVAAGGTFYVSPRVLITGDGSGATATATVVGGVVTAINVTAGGTGYTTATVHIVEGPVVVLAGDSISTEAATPSNFNEHMYALLRAAIGGQNLRRNVTFFNRAIGAQTFTSFNGVANSNLPAWYSNPAKPWIDYIEELQPDLVIVAFGMNDAQNFVFAQFKAGIDKLVAFTPQPDVVLCTTLVPSAISANPDISSDVAQNGRDATAAYTRGWALGHNMGFLDFNRQLRLVRDGIDVREAVLREQFANGVRSSPWTAGVACESDFTIRATFAAIPIGWWTGRTLTYDIGTVGSNTKTQLLIDDDAGFIRITVRDMQPSTMLFTNQWVLTTSYPTPTAGNVQLDVSVRDQWLEVRLADSILFEGFIARFAGTFAPRLDAGAGNMTLTFLAGEFVRYAFRLDDVELWGTVPTGPYKGNALNHPSSLGVKYVFAPVIMNADWTNSPVTVGDALAGVTNRVGVNEPDPVAPLHITKRPYSSALNPAGNANNLLLEDATDPGLSLMSGPTGVSRIASGDDGNASQWVQAYNHNSDTYTETLGGTTLRQITATREIMAVPSGLASYTVATLPSATGQPSLIYVSNESGGGVPAFNDGSNWRRVTDRAIVS